MRVLMISRDPAIFKAGSPANKRFEEYKSLVDELVVVLFPRITFSGLLLAMRGTYDLVTVQDPFEAGLLGWIIARLKKSKLELQIHTDFLSPYVAQESFKNRVRVRLAKWLLPKADGIRVVSQRIKKSLEAGSWKLIATPNILPIWVDVEKLKSAPVKIDLHNKYPQFDFIILMASRLSIEKNFPLALDVFSEVVKKYPRTGLVIVGEGSCMGDIELGIMNYELGRNVILEGWVEDMASYYKTADLFLLTSNYEGYGRTLVEAAAVGCKIVTTDVGVAGDVIDSSMCIIAPVGDKNHLVQAIVEVIEKKFVISTHASIHLGSKEEYLEMMKEAWQICASR